MWKCCAQNKSVNVVIDSNKPNPALITGKLNGGDIMPGRPCESCYSKFYTLLCCCSHCSNVLAAFIWYYMCMVYIAVQSAQWYSWGPVHMQCRLCSNCWSYWKKYGGLKMPTRLGRLSIAVWYALLCILFTGQGTKIALCLYDLCVCDGRSVIIGCAGG